MKKMILAVSCALAFATWNALAEPSSKAAFEKIVVKAKANLETPAGQAYDMRLSTFFEESGGPLMQDCFASIHEPDASPFEMVFTLSATGDVRSLSVWPETNISTCLRDKLKPKHLPAPPADGYLAYMEMRLAP